MKINVAEIITENAYAGVKADKIRLMAIKDNYTNPKQTDNLFISFMYALVSNDIESLEYVTRRLFCEEIPLGLTDMIIEKFQKTSEKDKFVEDLKKSYIKRGTKGMLSAWYPIIHKI